MVQIQEKQIYILIPDTSHPNTIYIAYIFIQNRYPQPIKKHLLTQMVSLQKKKGKEIAVTVLWQARCRKIQQKTSRNNSIYSTLASQVIQNNKTYLLTVSTSQRNIVALTVKEEITRFIIVLIDKKFQIQSKNSYIRPTN